MKVASFIANRIAFNRQRSFSRFIIRLSIVATIISVTVMIVTLAFTTGFQDAVSQKVFSFWGHIHVQLKQASKSTIAEEEQIEKNDSIVNAIKQNPEVSTIHPFATKYAMLKTKEEMEGVLFKGFDNTYDQNHFKSFLKQGRWIQFPDSGYSKEVILSTTTAEILKAKLNDSIWVYFAQPGEELVKTRARKLLVCGIYKTGIDEYDKTFAISDIGLIQRLNDWKKNQIGGYEIFIKDPRKMKQVSADLYNIEQFPPTWDTKPVSELNQNIFDWLNMLNTNGYVLITIIAAVAIINLITCLIILVLERIRMVGVLKALGANDWTVQKIFLQHSTLITITGIVLGAIVGLGICWLQQKTGFIKLKEDAYYMSEAAVKIVWWHVVVICTSTLVICYLVLLIPSLIVQRVRPVKAIQFR